MYQVELSSDSPGLGRPDGMGSPPGEREINIGFSPIRAGRGIGFPPDLTGPLTLGTGRNAAHGRTRTLVMGRPEA